MTYISLDQIMNLVGVISNTFSGLVAVLEHPVSWAFDQFLSWYGPDSFLGNIISKVFQFLIFPIDDVPLYEVLFGTTLLFFMVWVLFKFFIDSLPLLG